MVKSLERCPNLVVEAPPGAGKTTRVPPALLGFGPVVVLEPRRLAARMAARRVAQEMGEDVGETVGYQVRFEEVTGPRTRLRFLTEGVLTRRLLTDPELKNVSTVVLDEFHERHLDGDVALALLRQLQARRPELRLVVMSATLDGSTVSSFLGDCPIVRSQGRLHPITIEYSPHTAAPLEDQVAMALERLLAQRLDGDVLVFLPGAAEIRRAQRTCQAAAARAQMVIVPLHGDLTPEEQDLAVLPGARRKVILSTNVAESSVTIDGVTAVIDSGLARIARDSPWTGLSSIEISRVSKASATQRAGRAGRTRAGRVIRLYPEEEFLRRHEREAPEITRRELSSLLLELHAMGFPDALALPWMDAPTAEALQSAGLLLGQLGAVDNKGLTALGKAMAALPLHPRLAALALEADRRGAGEEGCAVAALLSAGERLPPGEARHVGPSDLLLMLESGLAPQVRRIRDQIRRALRPRRTKSDSDEAILIAILKAFPDRLARRRPDGELLLAGGGSAQLSPNSAVQKAELLIAVEMEQRRDRGLPLVRLASQVQPEWLIDLFPERVTDRTGLQWNRVAERVEASSAILFDSLVIEESTGGAIDPEEAAGILAERAWEAGIAKFTDADELEATLARAAFAAQHSTFPALTEESVRAALDSLCQGLRSFAELKSAASSGGLLRALQGSLSHRQRQILEEVAPEKIRLQGGRSALVHYERGKPPWLASRLQDFFGMRETTCVASGKVPVVLHLLAPNHRPVQTTTDLAGFWERLYPQVRRELSRRYPRHSWPESP